VATITGSVKYNMRRAYISKNLFFKQLCFVTRNSNNFSVKPFIKNEPELIENWGDKAAVF
jgi:hypothetical protein